MKTRTRAARRRRVIKVIARELEVDSAAVVATADLAKEFMADNLDKLSIAVALENEFDLEISGGETARLTTVQQVLDLIEKKSNGE